MPRYCRMEPPFCVAIDRRNNPINCLTVNGFSYKLSVHLHNTMFPILKSALEKTDSLYENPLTVKQFMGLFRRSIATQKGGSMRQYLGILAFCAPLVAFACYRLVVRNTRELTRNKDLNKPKPPEEGQISVTLF